MNSCNNTRYWGNILHYFQEIPSTHTFATNLLAKSRPMEGTVILAEHQSHGRGQYGKQWESSDKKNLLFSSIIFPQFLSIDNIFLLNVVLSLAIHEMLQKEFKIEAKVKWPNDIYFDNYKLAGVLIQSSIGANKKIDSAVVSIGLNVNQVEWKERINASSISNIRSKTIDRQVVFNKLCYYLEKKYELLRLDKHSELMKEYNACLLGKNNKVSIRTDEINVEETLIRIEKNGNIITADKIGQLNTWTLSRVNQMGIKL